MTQFILLLTIVINTSMKMKKNFNEIFRKNVTHNLIFKIIPLRPTFYSYFKESFSDEYQMYQFIPLHSCDYLNKNSMKTDVATDESNTQKEM